jgi:hypothetical protein
MALPGMGPITAICYRATIDDPTRFGKSRNVGAYVGLTTRCFASGETDWTGRISKCGDTMLRTYLFWGGQCAADPDRKIVDAQSLGYLRLAGLRPGQHLFAGRGDRGGLTTRQYARLVLKWVASLDAAKFDTHSLRRTKAVLIYRRTGNLRAVQLLLGHSKIESTVRYLGIKVDDAIEIAEKIDI